MTAFLALIIPLGLLGLSVVRNTRLGINLSDEGYLVYGTMRLLEGDVPIRDFRAYDPARYYWCALWFWLLGPGFIAARVSMAVLSFGSVLMIVLLGVHITQSAVVGALLGCVSLGWMFPRHKQVEIFFSILCCCALYVLLSGAANAYFLGVLAALACAFGLNIFIYFTAATFVAVIAGGVPEPVTFGAKYVIALTVLLLVFLVVASRARGFLRCYLDRKVLRILRRGSTNLSLPKPWLGTSPHQFVRFSRGRRLAFQAIFTLIPVTSVLMIAVFADRSWLARSDGGALAMASACTAQVYFHHVYSRADLGHLAQAIHPVLIMVAACSHVFLGVMGAALVMTLCLVGTIALLRGEGEFPFRNLRRRVNAEASEVLWNGVQVARPWARTLVRMREIIQTHTSSDSVLFVAPACSAYLVLFDRKSAVYDTFPVYPSTPAGRSEMMAQFTSAAPQAIILSDAPIDQRDDLRFSNNYRELMAYIRKNYEAAMESGPETLYVRKVPNN
ncbi:MAG: hypothetical protein AAFZ99_08625 [Pseudomonadota bacterium]